MNYDKEYYIIERENNDNYPILDWDEERNPEGSSSSIFSFDEPIDDLGYIANLIIADPVPEHPELVDYHYMPPDVFSEKSLSNIKDLNINTAQLIPAKIWLNNVKHEEYSIFHIYEEIDCMHIERSQYKEKAMMFFIEKLSLDESILDEIKLENRLVFMLGEEPSTKIYHQSIVDKIMATNPKGVRFIRIDEWNIGSAFG